ncbi:M13 family peptidase [Tsuneonella suprasediminis]|uniref:M13 family peptidase n=1 Tax=Tsuneonella suprasediminis TaxID=2306996 RepID=A0A419QY98_9SPHN|nr:M13 family metallopeptidase [Tsuneonella suprasediminis]RJX65619.1 M13 family peptidase [Tsuneonella suprasediminis]
MTIKTAIAAGASALALTLAAPAFAADPTPAAAAKPAPAKDAAADEDKLPTMSFGTWGFDPAYIDHDVKPGDDFFAYANEKWLEANPLPAEFSRFGAFNLLREGSTKDVKNVVDTMVASNPAPDSSDARVVDVYNAFIDTQAIDAAGLSHAQPYLTAIIGADTLPKLAALWGKPGYPAPFGGGVMVDSKQPDQYLVGIYNGGLGLPDRDYYLDTSEKGKEIQQKYRDYLAFILGKAGYADSKAAAEAVYSLEDVIARDVSWDRNARRNRDLTYNAETPEQLAALAGDFPLAAFMQTSGLNKATKFNVAYLPPSPERAKELGLTPQQVQSIGSGVPGMFKLLSEVPVSTLQAWTIARFISGNASVLPSDIDAANFEFYGKTLSGTPEQRPRWKRAIDETESLVGELVGKAYVEKYFPPANKVAMDKLVANLRIALAESIKANNWMGADTKKEAIAKLDAFTPKIGYRDNLEVYEGLTMTADNPIANRVAAGAWEWNHDLAKLGGPIDRTEWGMLPETVNAYYSPSMNEIVFPAGILQPPFFNATADPAVNYGGIGAVIGHEMSHGFDDQGAKSDGTGALRNWWTAADREAFDKLGNKLVEQYDKFCPLDDGKTCVNGRFTLGENIGDLGGLSLAYRAYKLALNGKEAPVIDGLTGDQRFFLAWAQVWRSQQRDDAARMRIRTDPHSPEQYRVNGIVRNMDAWYKAFNVKPGDALYLPPEQRLKIW